MGADANGDHVLRGDDASNVLIGYDILDGGTGNDHGYDGERHTGCEPIETLEQLAAEVAAWRGFPSLRR